MHNGDTVITLVFMDQFVPNFNTLPLLKESKRYQKGAFVPSAEMPNPEFPAKTCPVYVTSGVLQRGVCVSSIFLLNVLGGFSL